MRKQRVKAQADAVNSTEVSVDQPSVDEEHAVNNNLSSISNLSDLFHKADING